MNPLVALITQNQTQIQQLKATPASKDEVNKYISILIICVFLDAVLLLSLLATFYNIINSTYDALSKIDSSISYNLSLLPILLLMVARPLETIISLGNNAYFINRNYARLNSYIVQMAFSKGLMSALICFALITALYTLLAPYILLGIPQISNNIPLQNRSTVFWGLLILWVGATLFDKWLGSLNTGMKLDALWG